jgi:hypothetical protein
MNVKSIAKRSLPSFIVNEVKKRVYLSKSKKCYRYDSQRFFEYSNAHAKFENKDKLIGIIIAEYHVIEKGITMPKMKLGFGSVILCSLIDHCSQYYKLYDHKNEQLLHAISVISEYKEIHINKNFILNISILTRIDDLLSLFSKFNDETQIEITSNEYFKDIDSSFNKFSLSRHSLRDFSGNVDITSIKNAIALAQSAPSACNRQPSRVYIVQNTEVIKEVLELQHGNRGFGYLADKLIILTAELSGYLSLGERNDVYVNGGIYAMNLLYGLHHNRIGACTLNWCSLPSEDLRLRNLCNIKDSETVILMVACGSVPDKFKMANSFRSSHLNIITII